MSKQSMREEAERLIRETMGKEDHRRQAGRHSYRGGLRGKCGAPNRVQAAKGQVRVKFTCKQCGHQQETM